MQERIIMLFETPYVNKTAQLRVYRHLIMENRGES